MRTRGWWVLATLVPFGLGSWAGFAYAARRAHNPRWYAWAAVYGVLSLGGFALNGETAEDSVWSDIAAALLILPWLVAIGHAFVVRPDYVRRVEAGGFATKVEAARDRLEARRRGIELAAADPLLAAELGIGRPDRPGAEHLDLVDVNNAPANVLERLPGVDRALAGRIERDRTQLGGWRSVEELGMALDLPGDLVERLRDDVVFLPRS
jgi:hypothetical protein